MASRLINFTDGGQIKKESNKPALHLHLDDNFFFPPGVNGDRRHPKTVAIESQPAPLIKSLSRKMSLFGEQRKRENYRGEKRDEGQREGRCGGGGGGGV